jgi:anthranilate synthase component 2
MGGVVESAKDIVHGKVWGVKVLGGELFQGVPQNFDAVRYHSLAIRRKGMPNVLSVDAETADGEVMAVSHATRPVFGVQFHPESIGSQHGKTMLANFLKKAGLK